MTTTQNDQPTDDSPDNLPGSPAGPDSWVALAIAQQEEYIKRWHSCTGINNSHAGTVGIAHSWDLYSTAPGGPKYEACWRCRVTRSTEDYYVVKNGSTERTAPHTSRA